MPVLYPESTTLSIGMAKEDPNERFSDIDQELQSIFLDPLKHLVESEVEKYLALSQEVRKILVDYSEKLSSEKKISSRSQFMFDTSKALSELSSLLEKVVEENEKKKISAVLLSIKNELLIFFNLAESDPGEESGDEQNQKSRLLPKDSQKLLSKLRPKISGGKKSYEDPVGNYILDTLINGPFAANAENFQALDEATVKLVETLWTASQFIVQKGNKIIESDFQFPEEEDFFTFSVDPSDIEKQENHLKEIAETLTSQYKEIYLVGKKEAEDHNFSPPPHEPGNKKVYTRGATIKRLNQTFKKSIENHGGWQNTITVLLDDWLLEMEISILKYTVQKLSFDFGNYVRSRFMEPTENKLHDLQSTVKGLIGYFDKDDERQEERLIEEIHQMRKEIKREMVLHIVPEMQKNIIESNIPTRIDEFEQDVAQQFKQLSKTRRLIAEPDYSRPIKTSEIEKISPLDLVSFQMMPEFMKQFPTLKQAFTRNLQEVQTRMEEIPEILDFSLKTALSFAEEKKEVTEAAKIGREGVQRAENKITDIQDLISSFFSEEAGEIKSNIAKLIEHLSEITDNENALQIKFRIAKAKAIEKSKEIRNRIKDYILNFLPAIRKVIEQFLTFLRVSTIQIRKQFIIEDQKHFVSTDVSDYLVETEQAINRLPFIYQRLFKTEPLTSFELYAERSDSIETIKTAYNKWKKGKFAPTVLIAERGWGKTTLINRFLKLKITSEQVLEFTPKSTENIDEFYNSIFEKTDFQQDNSDDRLPDDRHIVVLDGLERLFETKINGFETLTKFLQHISDSNEAVFWLITCQKQAWDYLDKILSISDYFAYHIRLPEFSKESLIKIIERRHNISGYRLMFLPETQKKSLISFKKQSDFGDQDELKEQYFTRMHKIVSGNLAQAFLFWMRSTAHVTEDSVFIEYLKSDYFNFLGSMSDTKLRMLKFIVLHNGITPEKLADLLRFSQDKSLLYLTQLHDDGIIIKKGPVYDVNPIIYRQVIDQLYLMNILH